MENYILHSKWLIPCDEKNSVLDNHALVIENGVIKDILPSASASQKYPGFKDFHFANHAIMPGFINCHTHIAMNMFRGLADDLSLMNWLNNHIWPAEKKWVSNEFVYDASLLAMAEMLRSGTTCFNDMYFFLDATAKATELSGIRAHIGLCIINFPTAWAKTIDEYFEKGLEFLHRYNNHPLINITVAPHAIYTVPEKYLLRVKEIAEKYNLKINMHVQETQDEIKQSLAATQQRPLHRLHKIGLVSPRLIAVHMANVNEEDLEILEANKPFVVHCPESNMKLASGTCPVETLKAHGITVSLGTDGAASNNDLDMISEMRTASFLQKLATLNPESLPAMEALKMATLNGAKTLGVEKNIGSLAVGKSADCIAIDLDQIETLPLYHPASQIVYAAARNQVTDVWVAGKQLLKNKELTTLDEAAIKAKAKEWRNKLSTTN